jgi:hypothetical protein
MAANLKLLNTVHAPASSSFFLRLIEDLGAALEPTQTQLQTLERSYLSTGQYLSSCEEFSGDLVEIHPHGSRELGTITRPLRNRDGFDIDLIARFDQKAWTKYSGSSGATLMLNQLHKAVSRYSEQHGLKLHRWERCVTLEYADGMCADIAPVIDHPHFGALHGELHGLIPDRQLKSFHPTNPRGFTKYFNSVAAIAPLFLATEALKSMASDSIKRADIAPLAKPDEVFGRLLCRLVQIMKIHRDVAFEGTPELEGIAPSSIFLTALASESYKLKATIPHSDPLDLFLSIIQAMPATIKRGATWDGREEWTVENPTAPGDNLASAMNTSEKQQAFTQWHAKLEGDIRAIVGAIDEKQGIDKVGELVTSAFGERVSSSARQRQLGREASARHIGKLTAVTAAGIILPVSARSNTFFGE